MHCSWTHSTALRWTALVALGWLAVGRTSLPAEESLDKLADTRAAASTVGRGALSAEESLPSYQSTVGVEGTLNSVGSDTISHLMTYWAEAFRKLYPNAEIRLEGKGSATAPRAISQGTAQLGPISRRMKPVEEETFKKVHGFRPTCIAVALDCVAVYVHQDNPIRGLTMAQLDCVFSKTRNCGFQGIVTWGDAGLEGDWAKTPIDLYGRNSDSGTHAYFKQQALLKGEYKDDVQEQSDSASVVQRVAADRAGIGYSSLSFKAPGVRVISLAKGAEDPLVEPTFDGVLSGSYPLGRTLYIYVAKRPGEHLPIVNEEFLKFVLSRQGQELVVKAGYGALPHAVVKRQLELLQ